MAHVVPSWQRCDCGLSGGTQKNVTCPGGYATAKSLRTTDLDDRVVVCSGGVGVVAAEQRSGSEGRSRRESLRLSADRLHPGAQRLCSQRLPLPERVSQGEFRVQMSLASQRFSQ